MKNTIAILAAAVWISLAEFLRNEFLIQSSLSVPLQGMGHYLYTEPNNGNATGFWALAIALLMFMISRKFNFWITAFTGWAAGFILLWVFGSHVLEAATSSLAFIVPLSVLEMILAAWIIVRISHSGKPSA